MVPEFIRVSSHFLVIVHIMLKMTFNYKLDMVVSLISESLLVVFLNFRRQRSGRQFVNERTLSILL